MSHNNDMINLVRLVEGKQDFAGEEVGQKPGDQVRGTDRAKVGGKDHPFKGRLVGEDTTLEDKLAKKYQDFKELQAKEKAEKKEKEELDEQGVAEGVVQYRVTLALKDDSAGPGESSTQRVNITVSAADEQSAIAQAKQKLIKSPKYSGARIVGAKIQQGVGEGYLDRPGHEDSPVVNAITRRILLQRTDLLSKYGPEKVAAAIDEVGDFVGDVDEIGSSDVSGWVRHVEQLLGNGVEEAAPTLVKGAAGLALGGIAAAGAPAIVGILGPLLGIPMAAYGAYSAAKLGMKGVEKLWDMAAEKLGGDDRVAQYANAKIAKLPPDQAKAATQVLNKVAESRRASSGTELAEVSNPTDKITVDVPLMLRIMEYAREDAKDDMDLHDVTERLVELSAGGKTLSMSDYDQIVGMTAEQKLSELGATQATPPQGTATTPATAPAPTTGGNVNPASGSVSPDEQTALNKIQTNPALKQQFDKLMTQATPPTPGKPMALDPEQEDALEKIKANAGLKGQYDKLIKQANPQANV